MQQIAFAEAWNQRGAAARRKLMERGRMTATDARMLDDFDAAALARFKARQQEEQ